MIRGSEKVQGIVLFAEGKYTSLERTGEGQLFIYVFIDQPLNY